MKPESENFLRCPHCNFIANTLSEAYNLGYLKKCLEIADIECQTGIATRDELILFVNVGKDG